MFICVQINEYKHPRRKRSWGKPPPTPGMMVVVYRVKLDASGRPQWVVHDPKAYWCAGYSNCEQRCKKWVKKNYDGIPLIKSAGNYKKVSMTEAAKLVDVKPPASLDRLTELLHDETEEAAGVIQNFIKVGK